MTGIDGDPQREKKGIEAWKRLSSEAKKLRSDKIKAAALHRKMCKDGVCICGREAKQ